ncbi:MAG: amidase [Microthrixaceae bacterium]
MTSPETAHEIAASIRSGQRSAVEVLRAHLEDIDRLNPVLNSVCFRDDEQALADATEIDRALGAGEDPGPFAGVPMLIKDLNDARGWPTTYGSKAVPDTPADDDELAVARLRSAGFVLSGKTTTPEFGAISVTETERFGATRNPWNTEYTPGGSSGGAGASVAAGILPAAHSSDGGGSIRIPASCNGLVGLKASRHRITARATKMTAGSTQGILTRTVADQAAILDVMAGPDPGAWEVAPPFERPLAEEVGADPGKLRIRVTHSNALGIEPAGECVAAVDAAVEVLRSLGHVIDETPVDWPPAKDFLAGFLSVWSTITAGVEITDPALLEPHNRSHRETALATNAITYSEAVMDLQRESRRFTAAFGRDYDLLLSPTMAIEPMLVGSIWEGSDSDPMAPVTNATPMAAYTALFNITGQPAISLPVHISAQGLPIGVQFTAPPFGEAVLVRLAAQLESEFRWHERALPDPFA